MCSQIKFQTLLLLCKSQSNSTASIKYGITMWCIFSVDLKKFPVKWLDKLGVYLSWCYFKTSRAMLGSVNNPLKVQRIHEFSSEENFVRHTSTMLFLVVIKSICTFHFLLSMKPFVDINTRLGKIVSPPILLRAIFSGMEFLFRLT